MVIKPLKPRLERFLRDRGLVAKWAKAKKLFEKDIRHTSLNIELLEPKWRAIYSFRLDRKYRALFFIGKDGFVEVLQITNHYKKA